MEEIKSNELVENSDKTESEKSPNSDKINVPPFHWIRKELLNKPNVFLVVGILELILLIVGCALLLYVLSNL